MQDAQRFLIVFTPFCGDGYASGGAVLIPLLPDFFARYPDITLDLGVSDRPVNLISDNVDCVIRGGPLVDSSLIARLIGHATLITGNERSVPYQAGNQ